jgi:hypothetical protein
MSRQPKVWLCFSTGKHSHSLEVWVLRVLCIYLCPITIVVLCHCRPLFCCFWNPRKERRYSACWSLCANCRYGYCYSITLIIQHPHPSPQYVHLSEDFRAGILAPYFWGNKNGCALYQWLCELLQENGHLTLEHIKVHTGDKSWLQGQGEWLCR